LIRFANTLSRVLVAGYALWVILSALLIKQSASGGYLFLLTVTGLSLAGLLLSKPRGLSWEMRLSIAFFVFSGGALVLQSLLLPDQTDQFGRSAQAFALQTLLLNISWFAVGISLAKADFSARNFWAVAILTALLWLVGRNLADGEVISYQTLEEQGVEGIDHLLLSEMLLLVGYYCYATSSGIVRSAAIFAIAAILFAGGGRATFYIGVTSVLAYDLLTASASRRILMVSAIAGLAAYLVTTGLNGSESLERMLFSSGFTADASYAEREEIANKSYAALAQQMYFGDPALIVQTNGTVGAFIHNLLSAIQFYGAIPFAIACALLLRMAWTALRNARSSNRADPSTVFGVISALYACLGILTSKHIGFPFFWIAAGFWAIRSSQQKPRQV
jgi:hypothetical protein